MCIAGLFYSLVARARIDCESMKYTVVVGISAMWLSTHAYFVHIGLSRHIVTICDTIKKGIMV